MEKKLISVTEASKRYDISCRRIREIAKDDIDCNLHLMVGRCIKIKTEAFDKYVLEACEL